MNNLVAGPKALSIFVPTLWHHWTDKNLSYLRSAKRLSSRQARWTLFLGRFNFTLTYRPGSRNIKPDALSWQSTTEGPAFEPELILPPSSLLATVMWGVEALVQKAQQSHPDPGGGPLNRLFVPDTVRSQVLQWGHSSKLTFHPGFHRTLAFVRQQFWWPSMPWDTRAFVSACSVCARSRVSHQTPAGQLRPLPMPDRPWPHIAVDFVTGLPLPGGNTTILTVVDRLSKAVYFIPVPKFPLAIQTADLLVLHVF